jgi:hypothetical protein
MEEYGRLHGDYTGANLGIYGGYTEAIWRLHGGYTKIIEGRIIRDYTGTICRGWRLYQDYRGDGGYTQAIPRLHFLPLFYNILHHFFSFYIYILSLFISFFLI